MARPERQTSAQSRDARMTTMLESMEIIVVVDEDTGAAAAAAAVVLEWMRLAGVRMVTQQAGTSGLVVSSVLLVVAWRRLMQPNEPPRHLYKLSAQQLLTGSKCLYTKQEYLLQRQVCLYVSHKAASVCAHKRLQAKKRGPSNSARNMPLRVLCFSNLKEES